VQGDLHIDKKTQNNEQRPATKICGSSADRPENITENQQHVPFDNLVNAADLPVTA